MSTKKEGIHPIQDLTEVVAECLLRLWPLLLRAYERSQGSKMALRVRHALFLLGNVALVVAMAHGVVLTHWDLRASSQCVLMIMYIAIVRKTKGRATSDSKPAEIVVCEDVTPHAQIGSAATLPAERAVLTHDNAEVAALDHRQSKVMTARELAELLRVERRSVYAATKRGEIPGVLRVGRKIRYSRRVISRWVRDGGLLEPGDRHTARPQPTHGAEVP